MVAAAPAAVSFAVRSTPITQGSFQVFHRRGPTSCIANLVSDNDAKLKEWRRLVETQARNAMKGRAPFASAVQVQLIFWMPTPKVHRGKTWAAVRGRNDLDKMLRACMDAMTTAAVYADDGLVARIETEKRWCQANEKPGVDVLVEAL